MSATRPALGEHALVIGGSIAGLLAARVLSDHFARVTIVDRDSFPQQPGARKGVPQAQHIHVLLTRGARLLEALFPGVLDELVAAGATPFEWGYDNLFYNVGGWLLRRHTGLISRVCSRDLLEFIIRRRVAALSGVNLLERCDVVGLLANAERTAVTGLRLRARRAGAEGAAGDETLAADFVVDASGRSSHAPQWLEELGYAAPAETNVNSFLAYVSRLYQPPAPLDVDWKALIVRGRAHEHQQRGGGIYPIEGGRWIVTLAGAGRDHPPLDDAGFAAFTESLGEPPLLAQTLRRATPLGPAVGYQRTDNRWRHYERLARWPNNFVVLGDAACAFNPVYGQGMTVAGLDALALDAAFRQAGGLGRAGLAQQFQKTLAQGLATPWLLATSEDYRVPQTEGPRPSPALRLMHAYVDRVTRAATHNVRVFTAYTEVSHLLRPPAALFHPAVVAAALWPSPAAHKVPPPL